MGPFDSAAWGPQKPQESKDPLSSENPFQGGQRLLGRGAVRDAINHLQNKDLLGGGRRPKPQRRTNLLWFMEMALSPKYLCSRPGTYWLAVPRGIPGVLWSPYAAGDNLICLPRL